MQRSRHRRKAAAELPRKLRPNPQAAAELGERGRRWSLGCCCKPAIAVASCSQDARAMDLVAPAQ